MSKEHVKRCSVLLENEIVHIHWAGKNKTNGKTKCC